MPDESAPSRRPGPWAILAVVLTVGVAVALSLMRGGAGDRSIAEMLPADVAFLVVADVEGALATDVGEALLDTFAGPLRELGREMREDLGFSWEEVSSIVFGGRFESAAPTMFVVFREPFGEGRLSAFAEERGLTEAREIAGRTLRCDARGRRAIGLVRPDVLVYAGAADAEAALRAADRPRKNRLSDLLYSRAAPDASASAVLDLGAAPWQKLARGLGRIAPILSRHVGRVVASVRLGSMEVEVLDPRDDVIARYRVEVDDDFLVRLLGDLRGLADDRPGYDEVEAAPAAVPAPLPPPAEPAADPR
jgi:hypothetical protein